MDFHKLQRVPVTFQIGHGVTLAIMPANYLHNIARISQIFQAGNRAKIGGFERDDDFLIYHGVTFGSKVHALRLLAFVFVEQVRISLGEQNAVVLMAKP